MSDDSRTNYSVGGRAIPAQFVISITLISVIPLLTLVYVAVSGVLETGFDVAMFVLLASTLLCVISGFILLAKYPLSVIRLRHYLERVAEGEYELDVSMYSNDDTVQAIEEYMKEIVRQAASRVEMIDAQSHQLVEAERNRVMVETVGAACHHLGQPAMHTSAHANTQQISRSATALTKTSGQTRSEQKAPESPPRPMECR